MTVQGPLLELGEPAGVNLVPVYASEEEHLVLAVLLTVVHELRRSMPDRWAEIELGQAGLFEHLSTSTLLVCLARIEPAAWCEPPLPAITVGWIAATEKQQAIRPVQQQDTGGLAVERGPAGLG